MSHYQGNLGTIRRQVIQKCRLDAELDLADVDVWINLTYQDVVQRTEALQKTTMTPMANGVSSYLLSDDVIVIKRLDILYSDGTVSRPMRQVTLEQILSLRHADSVVPVVTYDPVYALMGQTQVEVWPVPMDGQTLRFYYVYLPEKLVDECDTPVLREPFGSKCLEFGACVEAARFKKDNLLSDYEQAYEYWISRYTSLLNRSNIIGQFPISESNAQIPSDPSRDMAFNWR